MMSSRKPGSLTCVLVLALAGSSFAAEPRDSENAFRVRLVSAMDTTPTDGKTLKIETDTEMRYTWKVHANERTLFYNQLGMIAKIDGVERANVLMNGAKLVSVEDGKAIEKRTDEAPPAMQKMLLATFTKPLCTLTVDPASGAETRRALVDDPASRNVVAGGAITNAVIFHAPYFAGKRTWESPVTFFVSNDGNAEGKLTYTRVADVNGLPTLRVSGVLTRDEISVPGASTKMTKIKDVIAGTQSYDPGLREWVTGSWDVKVLYTLVAGNKPIATATGDMKFEFERVAPGKPKGK